VTASETPLTRASEVHYNYQLISNLLKKPIGPGFKPEKVCYCEAKGSLFQRLSQP
jgi:hypothetical protein